MRPLLGWTVDTGEAALIGRELHREFAEIIRAGLTDSDFHDPGLEKVAVFTRKAADKVQEG
jgi:hypothetical protein